MELASWLTASLPLSVFSSAAQAASAAPSLIVWLARGAASSRLNTAVMLVALALSLGRRQAWAGAGHYRGGKGGPTAWPGMQSCPRKASDHPLAYMHANALLRSGQCALLRLVQCGLCGL